MIVPVTLGIFIGDLDADSCQIWMQVRSETGALFGKWEFPGGRIEAGEDSELALRREVLEEVGIELPREAKLPLFKIYNHTSEERTLCFYVHWGSSKNFPLSETQKQFIFNYKEKSKFLEGKIPLDNHIMIDELLEYLRTEASAQLINQVCLP